VRTITGITGEQVLTDRGNLPSGLYFLRLNKGSEAIATGKLIAE
jgi:hypothetical protein